MPANAEQVRSFAPIVPDRPRVLILGSAPGVASLRLQQYYGHKHNAFWPLMGRLLHWPQVPSEYEQRVMWLRRDGVALWDVLSQCRRSGSLDSNIERQTEVPNDIASLLRRHEGIASVGCNGNKAAELFRRHIAPQLRDFAAPPKVVTLPSTSPANARLSREEKYALWRRELPLFD